MQRAVSLVLVIWLCAQSQGAAQEAPSTSAASRAAAHFRKGTAHSRAGDCAAATAEFEASYALLPVPESLYAIAQCQEQRASEPPGAPPMLFFIGAGATVLATGLGTFFALRALALHDDALALPSAHPDRSQKRERVENAELTADVFFGSAALLAVGTAIVFFVTDWDEGDRAEQGYREPIALQITPAIAPGGAGLVLRGAL